ncbi:potassium channel family protein [Cylindrospermopsis raciborskii]|uniref:Ion transporter n=1 Tax=Cylindrospermopsis raciborskii CENA302 TaxID=1170768 RepID=A0A9Q5QYE5_9CYAN|nr:potassium channel family protein [Cylindrospermopsis raciborskii]NLQ06613.1 ion transporter [Cylindrospermopsis raciborskii MVCC19]OHY34306.1 Ion transporter [Cylindrospermopsis raciborskii MVCC14]OPH10854.1 Ion transporter [Cylindrospermopsis raciborskii CENA302]
MNPFNREKIQFYLTDLTTPVGQIINFVIALLVLLSSAIFVVETYNISPDARTELSILNTCILAIFSGEYLLRLWSAKQKSKYFFSVYSIIDLMAIIPYFIGFVDIRFIRLLRWLRILRLLRFIDKKFLFFSISEDTVIFARILFTLFAIIFVYSGLIYQVEHAINPEGFNTFLDAFYFSVVTMTTVGFGDVTPVSEWGRLLTVFMILTGVALIPWQVGDLIKRFLKTSNQVENTCSRCGLAFHDSDALFCKRCGATLPQVSPSSQYQ